MDVLQRRRLHVTNVFHTDVWASGAYCRDRRVGSSGAYCRDRRPDTSTREVHICDASVEAAGVEVASELLAVGLINLCGCLRGVRPPITTTHAVTHLAETSFFALQAKNSSAELAYFATGLRFSHLLTWAVTETQLQIVVQSFGRQVVGSNEIPQLDHSQLWLCDCPLSWMLCAEDVAYPPAKKTWRMHKVIESFDRPMCVRPLHLGRIV
jgi:hypothetical protein